MTSCSKSQEIKAEKEAFPKAKVSFQDYENLIAQVKNHRAERLVTLKEFLEKSQDENTIILDTRSKAMYDRKHIKGAINLNFSDFTQMNLSRVIPHNKTKILIYCNNNFLDDNFHFPSKELRPLKIQTVGNKNSDAQKSNSENKEITLALNIPTYINLYGYGYKNVYELSQLISSVNKKDIEFEGTSVIKIQDKL